MQATFQHAVSAPRAPRHVRAEADRDRSVGRRASAPPGSPRCTVAPNVGDRAAPHSEADPERETRQSVVSQDSSGNLSMFDGLPPLRGAAEFDLYDAVRTTGPAGIASGPRLLATLRSLSGTGFAACAAVVLLSASAWAHDLKRPDLDGWYKGLKRPNVASSPLQFSSCCSSKDCHVTEAELRDGAWWARIGKPREDGDWDLLDWVRVPPDVVLKEHDNPTGEGVICHSLDWQGETLSATFITIWCFVPPIES